ncbi:unnamed protein product [Arctia plantaginis]|uniref:PCI domain-containing protein 2 homolog n=1 Tax=Arctia plantaginis TaxID=874455 RepID=A0A8S1BD86_ARCPL|nr:unnamed protein product [Arctia plantaginis]
MSVTGTLNQYIQFVERMFRTSQGIILSRLLSLRDEHVLNRNLSGSSDIASLVEGNCVSPLDEIIITHILCVKALHAKNYVEAYNRQSECVACVVKLLQSQKEVNWGLQLMYTVCLDLRLVAQKADAVSSTPQTRGKILEKAAESLLACFRVCAADNRASDADTKKLGMLNLVNQLLKIYFRIDKIQLCKPLIRAIDSSPYKDQFPIAQQVTYRYFVGRKAMFDSDYRSADEYLSFAFQKCHKDSVKNKQRILTYLVPVKMLLGLMPTRHVLEKYNLMEFWQLACAVKDGNLRGIDEVMDEHDSFFKNAGIYLIVEKLKIIARRNLFRKVCINERQIQEDQSKAHQIDIKKFQAALQMMGEGDVDADETQCIAAHLIYHNIIKGYISYQHQMLVVSKKNAFPPLSSFDITIV